MNKYQKNIDLLKNLKKPDAIIYDWDNTLVDTWPLIHSAINTTMQAMQQEEWSLEKVRNTVHKSMRESFPQIFGNEWHKAGEIYKNSYQEINLHKICLLPNSLNLLNFVHQQKIPQFIVSNKIGQTLRKEVDYLKITNLFFSIIGAGDANYDKPNPHPVDLALLGSDIDPQKHQIWFVGDTIADIDCAFATKTQGIVYGHSLNQISNTIGDNIMEHGINSSGALPLYFDHQELIDILKKF